MRARNLKPDFFKNERLAELPPLTRLLFQAYWCLADSRGVLEYRPKRIKAEAFPYDDCNIHDMTLQLVTCNFLQLHEIPTGEQFIKVVSFEKHQHPHPNECKKEGQPYKILESIDSLQVITCNDMQVTNQASSLNPSSLNPSSLNPSSLNPSSLNPDIKPAREKFMLPDWINKSTWDDFEEMRKKSRRPMTDAARRGIIKKLDAWREKYDVNEILTESVIKSWTGVWEPKGENHEITSSNTRFTARSGGGQSIYRKPEFTGRVEDSPAIAAGIKLAAKYAAEAEQERNQADAE